MLRNQVYDLIHAIQKKSEAITVYETYEKDCQGSTECVNLWRELKQQDEAAIEKLTRELEKQFRSGQVTTGGTEFGMR